MAITIILNAAAEENDLGVAFSIEGGVKMCHVTIGTDNPSPILSRQSISFPATDVTMPAPASNLDNQAKRLAYVLAVIKAYRDHGITLLGL
jgi:hypothetical protein